MSLVERFVVGVDIQRYSSRGTRRQVVLQRELDRMLDDAAEGAGISRKLWECRAAGDGEVAVLPADVDLLAIVRRFISELDFQLTDHNEDHAPETRIRLRVAMHIDVMTPGTLGYAGPALVVLQRLLDSAPVRAALTEAPEVNLAQIISESLYQKAVVPELGGLRPRQFQKVQVHLPAKDFHQAAYLYVPKDWSELAVNQPSNLAKPTGFPFPIPASQPVRLPKQPLTDALRIAAEDPPFQTAEPPALSSTVRELAQAIWESLRRREIERADALTTLALLESAGRRNNGWLRASDGRGLPDSLFTEVNAAWTDFSAGAWGFYAQRERLEGLALSGPREFRALSVLVGWRRDKDEIVPLYAEFARRGDHSKPFYPTLRNPEREQYPEWHDEWLATVMSVHVRLLRWGH